MCIEYTDTERHLRYLRGYMWSLCNGGIVYVALFQLAKSFIFEDSLFFEFHFSRRTN